MRTPHCLSHLVSSMALLAGFLAVRSEAQVQVTLTAAPGTVQVGPGQSVAAWLYDGQLPGPTLRLTEGDTLRVRVLNSLPEPTTIHWHGLPVPLGMDGVPGVTRPPVAPGQEFTYEFVAGPPGTYFFHPHVGLQLDRGLYGVLIVDPASPGDPPFDREHTIVLDDLLPGAPVSGQDPVYAGYLMNGKTSLGQIPLPVQAGEQVRIRFVNASAGTHYVVVVDGHPMTITHADGRRVQPVSVEALPIGAGERYDVLVSANHPGVWSIAAASLLNRNVTLVRAILAYAGSSQSPPSPSYVPPWLPAGQTLSYAQLASAEPVPPISSFPDRAYNLVLGGGMMSYVWTTNGQAFPSASPLDVEAGEDVRMTLSNGTMHWHPMHFHGHFFRLLGTAGGTTAPPVKDTVLVGPGMMSAPVPFEFVADNPGNWALHCHQIYHAEAGMMRLVRYVNGDADADGLVDGIDLDPLSAHPVLATDDLGGGYSIGSTVVLETQWKSGETAFFFLGDEAPWPYFSLGPIGLAAVWPPVYLGAAAVGGTNRASFPVAIPNAPALVGGRIGLQAAASHPTLAPGLRTSTFAAVTIH